MAIGEALECSNASCQSLPSAQGKYKTMRQQNSASILTDDYSLSPYLMPTVRSAQRLFPASEAAAGAAGAMSSTESAASAGAMSSGESSVANEAASPTSLESSTEPSPDGTSTSASVDTRSPNEDNAVGSSHSTNKKNDFKDFLKMNPALEVIEMGFSEDIVREVIRLKVVETGENYETAESLLDAVMAYQMATDDLEDNQDQEETSRNLNSPSSDLHRLPETTCNQENLIREGNVTPEVKDIKKKKKVKSSRSGLSKGERSPGLERIQNTNRNSDLCTDGEAADTNSSLNKALSPLTLKEENKKMKSSRLCKICLENEVRIVLLPCGHMICCSDCVSLIRNCTSCNQVVKGSIKVFLA